MSRYLECRKRQKRETEMKQIILTFFIFFLSNLASAAVGEAFQRRFEFIREDGKLVEVRDRTIKEGFKVGDFVEHILNSLRLLEQKDLSVMELEQYISDVGEENKAQGNSQENQYVLRAIENLKKIDFNQIMEKREFKEIILLFEQELSASLDTFGYSVIARPEDSRYFYQRVVTHQVVKWGINLLKNKLSSVPVFNTVSYIFSEVERMLTSRRHYHQNMLLHYLERYSEVELGLTKVEADMIASSIYESRIPWFAFWESSKAQEEWDRYGFTNLYSSFRQGSDRLRKMPPEFARPGERINFSFTIAQLASEESVILNLVNNQNLLDSRPGISYYFDAPDKVYRVRLLLQLAELGLSYLSLPPLVKNNVNRYIKSYYQAQMITEGALIGYLEANGQDDLLGAIKKQYINPF